MYCVKHSQTSKKKIALTSRKSLTFAPQSPLISNMRWWSRRRDSPLSWKDWKEMWNQSKDLMQYHFVMRITNVLPVLVKGAWDVTTEGTQKPFSSAKVAPWELGGGYLWRPFLLHMKKVCWISIYLLNSTNSIWLLQWSFVSNAAMKIPFLQGTIANDVFSMVLLPSDHHHWMSFRRLTIDIDCIIILFVQDIG